MEAGVLFLNVTLKPLGTCEHSLADAEFPEFAEVSVFEQSQ